MGTKPGLRNGKVPGMAVVPVPGNDIMFSKGYGFKKTTAYVSIDEIHEEFR